MNGLNLLRQNLKSPTMMHLQNSIGNLDSINDKNGLLENKIENKSRPITPKPFNCKVKIYLKIFIYILFI